MPTHADAVWFDSNWNYKVEVQVNPTKVGTTTAVTSYPVYNDCGGFPASFWTNASSSGADIRVLESDEATETAFELVSFSTSTKRCELHFMADALATTSSSTFYIYYGNATATAYAVTDTYGRNNVWSSTHRAVYHLGDLVDSTGNGYTLTNNGTTTFSTGSMGDAASITAASQYLSSATALGLTATQALSIRIFFKMASETTVDRDFYNLRNEGGAADSQIRGVYEYNGGTRRMRTYRDPNTAFSDKSGNIADNTWRYYKATWTNTASNLFTSINNVAGTTGGSINTTAVGESSLFTIGSTPQYTYTRPINGLVDEFRVSGSVLSASFITTEYNNLSSTSTFFYIGPEETNATSSPETSTFPILDIHNGIQMSGGILISM